jgi:nucleotide-binding universal stress UspA family protein
MFEKILATLDFADTSREVFDHALALAQATGATLTLLHVLSPTESGYPDLGTFLQGICHPDPNLRDQAMQQYAQQWQVFEQRDRTALENLVQVAQAAGVTVAWSQPATQPGPAICAEAKTQKADLIVMGRHGHRSFNPLSLGSVSQYVLQHGPCAVLLVPTSLPVTPAPTAVGP